MFGSNAYLTAKAYENTNPETRSELDLNRRFRSARARARWVGFVSRITGRSADLEVLAEVVAEEAHQNSRYEGLQTVALDQIRGTENRGQDFDREFNPRQDASQARWVGIAAARKKGRGLPPVSLIRVGSRYYVRDGHHRISVARALGEGYIEAEVTAWS